ncbi:MAG: hypothetical protein R2865_12550 [Deinococcales bacterium]
MAAPRVEVKGKNVVCASHLGEFDDFKPDNSAKDGDGISNVDFSEV